MAFRDILRYIPINNILQQQQQQQQQQPGDKILTARMTNWNRNKTTTTTTTTKPRRMPSAVASLVWLVAVLLLAHTNSQTHSSSDASSAGKRTTLQLLPPVALAFRPVSLPRSTRNRRMRTQLAGQIGEPEAKKAIDKVVQALRKDSSAKTELGNLKKVENVLGYGSPQAGKIAVRFNASFSKGGKGFLGMGGGKAKDGDQRGTMVGQVKASVDEKSGKVLECSVFRDLGYGRAFNLKTK